MKYYLIVLSFFICTLSFGQSSKQSDVTYSFIEALKNKEFNNIEQAAYLFRKAFEYDSTCGACYYEYSLILKSVGDFKSAFKYADSAAIIDPDNYWYLQNRIDNLMVLKDYRKAEIFLADMIKKGLAKIEDKYDYANVCFLLNKGKNALEILNQIEKENGVSEIVSIAKYRYYYSEKKYDSAEKEIKNLLIFQPDNIELYGILADLYAIQKNDNDAIIAYKKLIENDSNNIAGNISFARFYISRKSYKNAENCYNRIFKNNLVGFPKKMLALDNLLKDSPDDFTISYLRKIFYYLDGEFKNNETIIQFQINMFNNLKEYDSAFNSSLKLVDIKKDSTIYWEKLFYFGSLAKKDSIILNLMPFVKSKFKENAFLNLVGGMVYFNKNDYRNSIDMLNSGIDNVTNIEMLKQYIVFMADSYYKLGIKDSAFLYYDIGVSRDSNDVSMLNNYAYYLSLDNKELNKALKMSEKTILAEPKSSYYLDTYAWILYKMKRYREALKYIQLADKYAKNRSSEIKNHYGDILYCNGDKKKAEKYWIKALNLGAEKNEINKKLKSFICE